MDWRQLLASNVFWSSLAGILSSGFISAVAQVKLSSRYAEKLETLKKDLSVELFERQTKFAWLHTERSKVLVRIYRLLSRVDKAFNDITRSVQITNEQLTKEDRERAAQAYNMFFNYYVENDVLLDDGLLKMLRSVDEEYRRVWADFVIFDKSETNPQAWADAWKKVGEIGLTLREIRRQVQQLLGMDEHVKIQSLKKTTSS